MQKALDLAQKGKGTTSPNPMVGAVVVKNDVIIGQGYHQYYGGPHAEVYALEEAGQEAKDAVLYVNLEPCSHYGKTPPCSRKIIKAGISRVVIAMEDPNPQVSGRGISQLKEAGIEVKVGVLEKKAKKLNEAFIKYITDELPFVYLKTAQTLDGYLATKTGSSKWITNKKARLYGHRLRHKVDAILVGVNTIIADDPRLTARLPEGNSIDPLRVILDSRLRIPLDSYVLNHDSSKKTIVVSGTEVNSEKLDKVKGKNNVVAWTFPLDSDIPIKNLLEKLYEYNISSLLVEGGGRVNYSFLQEGFVDKYFCFIAPHLLGGDDGIATFRGDGPDLMKDSRKLKNTEIQFLDDNLLVIGEM